jgi:hypothetical protein
MKVAIMQPYFLPYIGYFQLIANVDKFVLYDNIQYTKKGWINRNRFLVNGKSQYFTIPIKRGSDYLSIQERELSENRIKDIIKLKNKIYSLYCKAPEFKFVFPIVRNILDFEDVNLFGYIYHSIKEILFYLEIDTEILLASNLHLNEKLKSQEKVLEICKVLKAKEYINPIGGTLLYTKDVFKEKNLKLYFLKTDNIVYSQLENEFIPWLSIIDVMMFNSKEDIQGMLNKYTLI